MALAWLPVAVVLVVFPWLVVAVVLVAVGAVEFRRREPVVAAVCAVLVLVALGLALS